MRDGAQKYTPLRIVACLLRSAISDGENTF